MHVWRVGYPKGGTSYSQKIKPLPFQSPTDFSCFKKKVQNRTDLSKYPCLSLVV